MEFLCQSVAPWRWCDKEEFGTRPWSRAFIRLNILTVSLSEGWLVADIANRLSSAQDGRMRLPGPCRKYFLLFLAAKSPLLLRLRKPTDRTCVRWQPITKSGELTACYGPAPPWRRDDVRISPLVPDHHDPFR